ncbi:methyltransferase CmcJ [Phlyctema vagabunda]|uniref:Methyltransferase CmcJ n=1 Tax=Phlyctema vagabunda TaxID=108571 RepID=A0ABR4P718_9HELO
MTTFVRSNIGYLARDPLYERERPYAVAFPVGHIPGAKQSNHLFDDHVVNLNHVGDSTFDINQAGFTIIKSPLPFTGGELAQEEFADEQYFKYMQRLILDAFPQYTRIVLIDTVHRKRNPAFPLREGTKVDLPQPLSVPHTDFTSTASQQLLEEIITARGYAGLDGLPWDQLNLWRVLKGPNRDWPLAVCDGRSVNKEKDVLVNDIVLRDLPFTNTLLTYNKNHRWHFCDNQGTEDVLVFRNAASSGREVPSESYLTLSMVTRKLTLEVEACWHAATNPYNVSVVEHMRESIEMRVFAFL